MESNTSVHNIIHIMLTADLSSLVAGKRCDIDVGLPFLLAEVALPPNVH